MASFAFSEKHFNSLCENYNGLDCSVHSSEVKNRCVYLGR